MKNRSVKTSKFFQLFFFLNDGFLKVEGRLAAKGSESAKLQIFLLQKIDF